MSVFNVGGAMAIIGVEMEEGLEEEAGSDTAVGGANLFEISSEIIYSLIQC